MSHFFTLVILPASTDINLTDNTPDPVAKLLQPYHNFECTGTDDQYVQTIIDTAEQKAAYEAENEERRKDKERTEFASFVDFMGDGWIGRAKVKFGKRPNLKGEHKYGYFTVDAKGEVMKCVNRTNPNSKWDWWCVGGRWDGMLSGDRQRSSNYPAPIDNEHTNVVPIASLPDDFSCFAIVTPEGEWIERGEMGWWACVADEKDAQVWKDTVRTVLEKYKDCIGVAVDCHI